MACTPTVFWWQWPEDVMANIKMFRNPGGTISNSDWGGLVAVNDMTEKNAPKGAIDQIGKCLFRIIHEFAELDTNTKVFMAKWDIKDGFWHMDCAEEEE